jgi:hypothetical protein
MEKELPIYRLDIVEDLESNVEVDFVALVDRPAIEKSFLKFDEDDECLMYVDEFAKVGERGAIRKSDKAPKSDTPNKNPKGEGTAKGDASGKRGAKVTEEQEKTLQNKVDEFNEKESNTKNGRATLGALKSVFQRGLGAYNTSHSPKVKSAEQWAFARVNAFLYLLKNGRPQNAKYTSDYDLLPNSHPKADEMSADFKSYSDYPDSVSNNAKAALKWAEENGWGSCGTPVGKQRANQLAKGEPISYETIKRMYSFLSRHKENAQKSKGYGDGCGQLMYDAWGGASALSWAEAKIKSIERQSFAIQDEEEKIISGVLMLAETPIYRNDTNGEYYVVFTKNTIKKIAQKYFKKGYQNNVNLMHDSGQVMEGITMFESWIVDENRGIKPMKGFEDVKDGSWFGSFKVENDEVWQMIKDGKIQGFSVEGIFNYKTQSKEEKMMQDIIDILKSVS